MKHFTSVADVDNLPAWIELAKTIKANPRAYKHVGAGKTLGLLFFNNSLRTRLSTQLAAKHLGMEVMVMNVTQEGWALETGEGVVMNADKAEHIIEAAGVIGRYCDVIGIRAFPTLTDQATDEAEPILTNFIRYAQKPILSLESALRHPLQSFADLLTIEETKTKPRPKVVLSWTPHPRALPHCVANSFAEWMAKANVELFITHPKGYALDLRFTTGATITHDRADAFKEADFIYAKNWSAYSPYGKILHQDDAWRVKLSDLAPNSRFMHCLPTRRNLEVDDAVLDSDRSIVLQQAENRVWSAAAALYQLLNQ